jgi:hypothetical protein
MISVPYKGVRKSNVVDKVEGGLASCMFQVASRELVNSLQAETCNLQPFFYSKAAIPVISAPVISKWISCVPS